MSSRDGMLRIVKAGPTRLGVPGAGGVKGFTPCRNTLRRPRLNSCVVSVAVLTWRSCCSAFALIELEDESEDVVMVDTLSVVVKKSRARAVLSGSRVRIAGRRSHRRLARSQVLRGS